MGKLPRQLSRSTSECYAQGLGPHGRRGQDRPQYGNLGYRPTEGQRLIPLYCVPLSLNIPSQEIMKVNGFQVAPAELEGCILDHPAVADCCVVGVPDAYSWVYGWPQGAYTH